MNEKKAKSESIRRLQELRNIGPATAMRLYSIGINSPQQLKTANPEELYEKLKRKEGGKLDRCVLYQLRGAVLDIPWSKCRNHTVSEQTQNEAKRRVNNMPDKNLAPVCRLYSGPCEYFENHCQGCGYVKGRPFWTAQMELEACPLYDCCLNKKRLEHCGLCDEFPCDIFTELRDPSLSEEAAKKALYARQNELAKRKQIGTEKWIKEKEACKK